MKHFVAKILFILILLAVFSSSVLHAEVEFEEHLIADSLYGACSIFDVDLDQDGDFDLVLAVHDMAMVLWFENDGNNQFTEHTVSNDFDYAHSVAADDLDDDNDLDIIACALEGDRLSWWENDGSQNFTEHNIIDDYDGAKIVAIADIDNDLDTDILCIGHVADQVSWWENNGGNPLTWTQHIIDDEFDGPHYIRANDVNEDGNIDVLAVAEYGDEVAWWENVPGEDIGWVKHTITNSFNGARCLAAEDLDNDSDMDIVATANADGIRWWENFGNDNFIEHNIVDGDYRGFLGVAAADINGDSFNDIVTTSVFTGEITYWENSSDYPATFEEFTLKEDLWNAEEIIVSDLDGDMDLDIIATGFFHGQLIWWENLGNVPPTPLTIEIEPLAEPTVIFPTGGFFQWNVVVTNNTEEILTFDAWTDLILPSGFQYGPLDLFENLALLPGTTLEANPYQVVPEEAPNGLYYFFAKVGDHPGDFVQDSLEFVKLPLGEITMFSTPSHDDWESYGWTGFAEDEKSSNVVIPSEFRFDQPWPNPFNPVTNISVALPEISLLTIEVYDIQGRLVSSLYNGYKEAGYSQFRFNASGLSSGIYFIRATVNGSVKRAHKVVYMK